MSKKTAKANAKAKPATKPAAPGQGYAGHIAGSRKGTIHELFNKEGEETAWVRGLKMGLKEGTLRSWFAAWRQTGGRTKPKHTAGKFLPAGKSATDTQAQPDSTAAATVTA